MKVNIMKKILRTALMLFSLNTIFSCAENNSEHYMNRYIDKSEREYLLEAPFIQQYNSGLKAMYLAKVEARYDMGWMSYLKSYVIETAEGNTLRSISQVEDQLRGQLNSLQNNTWSQWGWSAAKYTTAILGTIAIMKNPDLFKKPLSLFQS